MKKSVFLFRGLKCLITSHLCVDFLQVRGAYSSRVHTVWGHPGSVLSWQCRPHEGALQAGTGTVTNRVYDGISPTACWIAPSVTYLINTLWERTEPHEAQAGLKLTNWGGLWPFERWDPEIGLWAVCLVGRPSATELFPSLQREALGKSVKIRSFSTLRIKA